MFKFFESRNRSILRSFVEWVSGLQFALELRIATRKWKGTRCHSVVERLLWAAAHWQLAASLHVRRSLKPPVIPTLTAGAFGSARLIRWTLRIQLEE